VTSTTANAKGCLSPYSSKPEASTTIHTRQRTSARSMGHLQKLNPLLRRQGLATHSKQTMSNGVYGGFTSNTKRRSKERTRQKLKPSMGDQYTLRLRPLINAVSQKRSNRRRGQRCRSAKGCCQSLVSCNEGEQPGVFGPFHLSDRAQRSASDKTITSLINHENTHTNNFAMASNRSRLDPFPYRMGPSRAHE
jgi:hypothetical protein